MTFLVSQSCASCRHPWCSTPDAARKWLSCPFCGQGGALSGVPRPPAVGAMAIRVSQAEEAHIDAMRVRSYHLALQRRHISR